MMTMAKFHLGDPPSIHRARHRLWLPVVEVANQFHHLGSWGGTKETDRFVEVVVLLLNAKLKGRGDFELQPSRC